jgi:hypothetical protein
MGDLISANDAANKITATYCVGCNSYNGVRCRSCDINSAISVILDIPAVDAEPVRRGEWIDMQEDDYTEGMWRCSACGEDSYFDISPVECVYNYCPNCGTRMTKEETNE